ncbi:ribonuclease Y [candidate division KSB1 bacterium 4572_119]|nr:MAG: ribonuclease Y [candidate division KSB1 bacterium 4572_119]
MEIYWMIAVVVVGLLAFVLGWLASNKLGQAKIANAEVEAEKIIRDAEKTTETLKKEKLLEVKDEWIKLKQNFENETKSRRNELLNSEKQLASREINMDRKVDLLNKKEKELTQSEQRIKEKEIKITRKETELDRVIKEQNERLEKISGMSKEDAKKILMENLIDKAKQESAQQVKEIKDKAKITANKEAKEVIIQAIQRTAADHSVETTVSVVNLPNEEMKGRIIGREGRNIRSFETATGIEVIVDDTPEAVILSGFDPLRREIARISLERLIVDGRIHPSRIEEVVNKVSKEMEEKVMEIGEQAMMETGVHNARPEMVKLLGKLNYRTSYGQNVLQHSKEVAYLAGLMAADLGLDAALAKRSGLFHDIGKAIDKNTEGTHTEIGGDIAKRYKEHPIVVNSIMSHHEDIEPISPISVLVQAADAISGSRPGARRETLEGYVKRLEKLEKLAESFSGVVKTYAIQAGREVRVMVEHEQIDDALSDQLAEDIAQKIQDEMEYPGQIKVTVIREYRSINFAK